MLRSRNCAAVHIYTPGGKQPADEPSRDSVLDPQKIRHLTSDISGLGLTTLRHVANLAHLERLNASANQLTSVEDAKEHLAAMGRGGALLHLVLSRNPLCPGAKTAPEPLAAATNKKYEELNSSSIAGAAIYGVRINARRPPAKTMSRTTQCLNAPFGAFRDVTS